MITLSIATHTLTDGSKVHDVVMGQHNNSLVLPAETMEAAIRLVDDMVDVIARLSLGTVTVR